MPNEDQQEKVSNDSLNVVENEDGTFTIEWDPNDPRYEMFNDMTPEQMSDLLIEGLKDYLNELEDTNGNESV